MKRVESVAELNRFLESFPGKRVVFTNGVFDLLHPGHIDLLNFCKSRGDILIVGVNDDASVRRLKGEKRPIFPLSDRLELLAALETVDFVVSFGEDTPLELINSISRIDVLVKGGDYSLDQIVGRREVEARGGTVISHSFSFAFSSSSLIEKILKQF
jgi:D-beta-D-heptose 7-phosphate kinase/D-beta-D-heptose 1-phosphate adenosyltransferase